jgi:hypothetical protein
MPTLRIPGERDPLSRRSELARGLGSAATVKHAVVDVGRTRGDATAVALPGVEPDDIVDAGLQSPLGSATYDLGPRSIVVLLRSVGS